MWGRGAVRAVLRDAAGDLIPKAIVEAFGVSPNGGWLAVAVKTALVQDCGTFVERVDGADRTCVALAGAAVSFAADSSCAVIRLGSGKAVHALLPATGPPVLSRVSASDGYDLLDCAAGSESVVVACLVQRDRERTVGPWVLRGDGLSTHAALPPRDDKVGIVGLAVDAKGVSLTYKGRQKEVHPNAFVALGPVAFDGRAPPKRPPAPRGCPRREGRRRRNATAGSFPRTPLRSGSGVAGAVAATRGPGARLAP